MATTTHAITVEEFDRLALAANKDWELQDGAVVEVSLAHVRHSRFKVRMLHLMEGFFPAAEVLTEYPCQIGEYDKRCADVAVVSIERAKAATVTGMLGGAPEMVVEVLSPSNTVQDLRHYRRVCFDHGAQLFLVIDPADQTIDAAMPGTPVITYTLGESIPIAVLGVNAALPVASIFEGVVIS